MTTPTAGAQALANRLGATSQNATSETLATDSSQRDTTLSLHDGTETSSKTAGDGASLDKDRISESELEKVVSRHSRGELAQDPNLVGFESPEDPANPQNWPRSRKWIIVGVLSFLTFVTPLASSMFTPGVPQVLRDFDTNSLTLSAFVVSVYVLGYAAGPIVIAPLSELYGRALLYNGTNVLFIIFTVACAVAGSMGQLVGFRFLEGFAGSAVLTLGGGTVADLFIQEERGRAMAIWSIGPLIGPVVGPIAGGFLTEAAGWRWVFYVIAIAAGAASVLCFLVYKETYAVTILERKSKALRKETGNLGLRSVLDQGLSPKQAFLRAIMRPMKMLIFQPIVLLLSIYNAIIYGYLYLLFTTITVVFEQNYGFDSGIVGLTFLGIGVGMMLGLVIFGFMSDKYLKAKAAGGEMKPEYRLPPMIPASIFIPAGLFLYGWTAQYRVHWIVPIIGTGMLGFGILGAFMAIQTYLVDAFTLHAASALAANTILRSLVGALLPLAGPDMYATLGLGWGSSLLGFIALALLPIPVLFYKYGERIRTSSRFQVQL